MHLKAPLFPLEAAELPCEQSLVLFTIFVLLSVLFNSDAILSVPKAVASATQSTELLSPLAFVLAAIKAKFTALRVLSLPIIPSCGLVAQKAVFTTAPRVGKLLSSAECFPLIDPLTVGLAFTGHPVSTSSTPENLSPEEHAELLRHTREVEFG